MHSSRMRTARSSSHPRRSPPGTPLGGGPQTAPLPRTRHPPRADPPGSRHPPRSRAPREQAPPWTEFLTHASENITLSQTLFAGGNNIHPRVIDIIIDNLKPSKTSYYSIPCTFSSAEDNLTSWSLVVVSKAENTIITYEDILPKFSQF